MTAAPSRSSEELGSPVKRAARVLLPAGGALSLSHLLQQLSGRALWVPAELRIAVEVFTTLLGTVIFLLIINRPDARMGQGRTGKASAAAGQVGRHSFGRAVVCAVAAVALFVLYMWLRAECVISWDARSWMQANRQADGTVDTSDISGFVDVAHGQVYVPLVRPKDDQAYIDEVGKGNEDGLDGLQWMLLREPDRLFDWLRTKWRMYLWVTSVLFLVVHLGIIACVAAAAAFAGGQLGSAASVEGKQETS